MKTRCDLKIKLVRVLIRNSQTVILTDFCSLYYFKMIQDRIVSFIEEHSRAEKGSLEKMMMNTSMLSKDLGTMLVGRQAVEAGLIDEVGGLDMALGRIKELSV